MYKYFWKVSPRKLRKMNPIWRAYFSNAVKPPTSLCVFFSSRFVILAANGKKWIWSLKTKTFLKNPILMRWSRCWITLRYGRTEKPPVFFFQTSRLGRLGQQPSSYPIGCHPTARGDPPGCFFFHMASWVWKQQVGACPPKKTGEGSKNPMYMESDDAKRGGVWMVFCYLNHILLLIS